MGGAVISCPTCGHSQSTGKEVRNRDGFYQRRRTCDNCGHGFVTREYSSNAISKLLTEAQEKALDVATQLFGGR